MGVGFIGGSEDGDLHVCIRCGRRSPAEQTVCSCGEALVCPICEESLSDGRPLTAMRLRDGARHNVHLTCKEAIEDGSVSGDAGPELKSALGRILGNVTNPPPHDDALDALNFMSSFADGFRRGFLRKMEDAKRRRMAAYRAAIEEVRRRQQEALGEALQASDWLSGSFSVNAVYRLNPDNSLGPELCPRCLVELIDKTCPQCGYCSKPTIDPFPGTLNIDPDAINYSNMSRTEFMRLMEEMGRKFGSMEGIGPQDGSKGSEKLGEARPEAEAEVDLAPAVKDFLRSLDLGGI